MFTPAALLLTTFAVSCLSPNPNTARALAPPAVAPIIPIAHPYRPVAPPTTTLAFSEPPTASTSGDAPQETNSVAYASSSELLAAQQLTMGEAFGTRCATGTVQCCQAFQFAADPVVATLLELAGEHVDEPLGGGRAPRRPDGVGVQCEQQSVATCLNVPLCCTDVHADGRLATGCSRLKRVAWIRPQSPMARFLYDSQRQHHD